MENDLMGPFEIAALAAIWSPTRQERVKDNKIPDFSGVCLGLFF